MRKFIVLGSMAVALVLSAGCAKKGTVAEGAPMTQSISAYKTAALKIEGQMGEKNSGKNQDAFKAALAKGLKEKNIFADLGADEAASDLVIKVSTSKVDEGSALGAGLGTGGDAEVALDIQFMDTKQGKSIGKIAVSGNSKKDVSVTAGGVNTDAVADRTSRAFAAAANQVVEYLDKHR